MIFGYFFFGIMLFNAVGVVVLGIDGIDAFINKQRDPHSVNLTLQQINIGNGKDERENKRARRNPAQTQIGG